MFAKWMSEWMNKQTNNQENGESAHLPKWENQTGSCLNPSAFTWETSFNQIMKATRKASAHSKKKSW